MIEREWIKKLQRLHDELLAFSRRMEGGLMWLREDQRPMSLVLAGMLSLLSHSACMAAATIKVNIQDIQKKEKP